MSAAISVQRPRRPAHLYRTEVARSAIDFTERFNARFAQMPLAPAGYVPELVATDGPSTRGGLLATQRIRFTPLEPGFPILVVGETNVSDGRAELRSLPHLQHAHLEHFGRDLALDPIAYAMFLERARSFFHDERMIVHLRAQSATPEKRIAVSDVRGLLFGAALMIAALASYWMMMQSR